MRDIRELKYFQSLPLAEKIVMTRERIRGWYEYWEGKVYIAFSGGKDSTVLLLMVRELYPDVEAVFVDTGLEYSQIRNFVKTFENVTIVRPKMTFAEVVKKYGYPLISKEVAHHVYYGRRAAEQEREAPSLLKILGQWKDKSGHDSQYNYSKYIPLLNTDFYIGDYCCDIMKKSPSHKFSKDTGKMAITGQMAEESRMRTQKWVEHGCNAFNIKFPTSNPMIFWTEQDVLRYIYENKIPICSVYGDVVHGDEQLNLEGQWETKFYTTGASRTGCVFCGFGAHLPEEPPRFQLLKQIDRKKYDFCFSGGEFNDAGIWQPNKNGLGMQYVYQRLNEIYGENFVNFK